MDLGTLLLGIAWSSRVFLWVVSGATLASSTGLHPTLCTGLWWFSLPLLECMPQLRKCNPTEVWRLPHAVLKGLDAVSQNNKHRAVKARLTLVLKSYVNSAYGKQIILEASHLSALCVRALAGASMLSK